jgi:hypothetical protein
MHAAPAALHSISEAAFGRTDGAVLGRGGDARWKDGAVTPDGRMKPRHRAGV